MEVLFLTCHSGALSWWITTFIWLFLAKATIASLPAKVPGFAKLVTKGKQTFIRDGEPVSETSKSTGGLASNKISTRAQEILERKSQLLNGNRRGKNLLVTEVTKS